MNCKQTIIITLLTGLSLICLLCTIIDQQKQIKQLQEQLHHEQMKYKIMINNHLIRDVIESGG